MGENPAEFVREALKPAEILEVNVDEEEGRAVAQVAEDQQSLAIGRGGQNVRLAARLTGWKIDIRSVGGTQLADETGAVETATPDEDQEAIDPVVAETAAAEAEKLDN